ncbi:MAG: c-type cytochrome [Chthoniobacteraceae bacterium]
MKTVPRRRCLLLVLSLALTPLFSHAEPQWIWTSKSAKAGEKATFKTSFEVQGTLKSATLTFTCDNGATAFINGQKAGENPDWQKPTKADVTKLVNAGANELRFEARNNTGAAALVATLTVEAQNGKIMTIESGPAWLGALAGSTEFKPAMVIAKYGAGPWGDALTGGGKRGKADDNTPGVSTDPATLQVAAGFKVELLYSVPKAEQGSWVSMTEDAKGRLIVCDQYGGAFRVTVPPLGKVEGLKVEPLPLPNGNDGKPLGGAHGLLYANDSLYLMNNEMKDKGLWRLRDTDGDDKFDKAELLRSCAGGGEHGPHGITLGPDGKSIYFVCGNHTKLPENLNYARPVAIGEDHLLPRLWDPNGHAKGILAPGGYVCKTDPEGKRVELFAGGFRNQYDICFDANGELFTYDSDMEWDMGTPWYMPTRINHIVSGGDYGWRSGSGRWPSYYADSLPAAVDIGPGSPTGTVFGTGAKFPAKYQRAMFALDWTYATMWAIHFTPDGASFKAEKEDFIAGKAFSVTDAIVRKSDGAMYVTIGGRRNQSGLYRITYTGNESTAPAAPLAPTAEAKLRHELEALQAEGTGPEAIEKAWPHLASKDRFIRFAARIALEHQPAAKWADRALAEKNPQSAIEALLGLARVGDKAQQPRIIEALGKLDAAKVSDELRLPLLRTWEVTFTRMGKPAPDVCKTLAAKFDPLFPHADPLTNRELVSLLVFLDSPTIVAKTVPLLDTAKDADITLASDAVLSRNDGYARAVAGVHGSRPNRQAIAYAYALRNATAGWTPELRKAFFAWFPRTHVWKGGNSFTKFLENIRNEALANFVPDAAERTALDKMSKNAPAIAANLIAPKGPGRAYTVDEVAALAKTGLHGRNFEQGKAMFASTLCINCHHFAGDGGNIGPDLTGAGQRYTLRDFMENVIEPSKVISDQYGTEQLEKKDGSIIVGRVVTEENGVLLVMTSALAPDFLTQVALADVKARKPFNVSMMPPALINGLNQDELLDLVAYALSGGNRADRAFAK